VAARAAGLYVRLSSSNLFYPNFQGCGIFNRRIARRTLQAMVFFGILAIFYQVISLVPAFHGLGVAAKTLGIQGETARDGRQTLTIGFLQECGNRGMSDIVANSDDLDRVIRLSHG